MSNQDLIHRIKSCVDFATQCLKEVPPNWQEAQHHLSAANSACTTLVNRMRGEPNPNVDYEMYKTKPQTIFE